MVTIVFMGWNFSTLAPSLHPCTPKTCLRVDPQRGLARGATWGPEGGGVAGVATATYGFFHGKSVGHPDTPLGSTGLPGVGGTWRTTRCHVNVGIILSSTKNRQNAQQFQDSDDFPWFVDWGWSNFILSRLPDDIIFGSAKDLVPTAQMIIPLSKYAGVFIFFWAMPFSMAMGLKMGILPQLMAL